MFDELFIHSITLVIPDLKLILGFQFELDNNLLLSQTNLNTSLSLGLILSEDVSIETSFSIIFDIKSTRSLNRNFFIVSYVNYLTIKGIFIRYFKKCITSITNICQISGWS